MRARVGLLQTIPPSAVWRGGGELKAVDRVENRGGALAVERGRRGGRERIAASEPYARGQRGVAGDSQACGDLVQTPGHSFVTQRVHHRGLHQATHKEVGLRGPRFIVFAVGGAGALAAIERAETGEAATGQRAQLMGAAEAVFDEGAMRKL